MSNTTEQMAIVGETYAMRDLVPMKLPVKDGDLCVNVQYERWGQMNTFSAALLDSHIVSHRYRPWAGFEFYELACAMGPGLCLTVKPDARYMLNRGVRCLRLDPAADPEEGNTIRDCSTEITQ